MMNGYTSKKYKLGDVVVAKQAAVRYNFTAGKEYRVTVIQVTTPDGSACIRSDNGNIVRIDAKAMAECFVSSEEKVPCVVKQADNAYEHAMEVVGK
jgi:hypothetical protein